MNRMQQSDDMPEDIRVSSANNAGYTGESVLRIRLDTQAVVQQIEHFLRGEIVKFKYREDGSVEEYREKIGKSLANDEGVHALLSFINMVNSQTVQGYYEWDHWREEVSWIREQLAIDVFSNMNRWGIESDNIGLICNGIMNIIKPFLTRLVNNEERKSYANYHEHSQTNTVPKKGLLSGFGL